MSTVLHKVERPALVVILLAAACLRFGWLDQIPPGWRDDELINSLVISQHALDGDLAAFYPDASGHEGLYHILNAGMLALFGPGLAGIRWLSAILGVLSVWLTFLVGRELFGRAVGLVAATALAFSFWSLMYSRIGLRHVSLLPPMLAAFLLLWRGLRLGGEAGWASRLGMARPGWLSFALAGLSLGASFYTYFAARGLPLVLVALGLTWLVVDRRALRRQGGRLGLTLLVAALVAVPLLVTLVRLPEMTDRVEELAVPLAAARGGDLGPLFEHVRITLSMFHADGDGEWLYNLPHRPVFDALGAILLLVGLALCLYRVLPLTRTRLKSESAFLLLWFFVGLGPAFVSVPPASLGHTIVAQPAAYLLPAVALAGMAGIGGNRSAMSQPARRPGERVRLLAAGLLAVLFLASNGTRDLRDYFYLWPERGMVRFLYRADIRDLARYVDAHDQVGDLVVGGGLAGPWDGQALSVDLNRTVRDRWFDPRRALVFPLADSYLALTTFPPVADELKPMLETASDLLHDGGAFRVYRLAQPELPDSWLMESGPVSFVNGLVLTHIGPAAGGVVTAWRADRPPFGLPPFRLVSNPPPPGIDPRLRLAVFLHLTAVDATLVAGDDGLWVDPYSLQPGDLFVQLHFLPDPVPAEAVGLAIGLYDPVSGERVRLSNGEDRLVIPSLTVEALLTP